MIMVNSDKREIFLYDMIGPSWMGFDAADTLVEALGMLGPGDISVRINSPGGDVFEGYAMYTNLKRHVGKVSTYNDGLVASAATFPFLAGQDRYVSPLSQTMIHEASTFVGGNASDLLRAADLLEKINVQLAELYSEVSGKDVNDVLQLMADETWLGPKDAKELKFATGDQGTLANDCRIVPQNMYRKTPAAYLKPQSKLVAAHGRSESKADERKEKILRLTGVDLRV